MFVNYIKNFYRSIIPKQIRKKIFMIRSILFSSKEIFFVEKNSHNQDKISKNSHNQNVVNKTPNNEDKFSYNEDGLVTNHIVDFMRDEKFIKNYFKAADGTNHKIIFRAYILNYFASYALKIFNNNKGCFIELGTHKGLMSKVILLNSNFDEKIDFYLFDTFTGIPLENIRQDEIQHVKEMNENVYNENVYEFVKNKFSDFPFVKIVKGCLPETLKNQNIILKNIQFLHIDLNNAHAEIESIEFLYDNILKGAPVILDDYCYSETYRPQKNAWDKFAKEKGFKILSLPTGQGLFLKI